MSAAGRMKLTPATPSPAQPARTNPTLIAISVDVGPGDKVRRSQHVQELLSSYPLSLADYLSFQERNVRCWPTETDRAQLQEEGRQFAQAREVDSAAAVSRRSRGRAVHAR